jgi:hypothetical protein
MSDEKTNLLSNEALSGPPFAGVIERGLDHRSPIIANLRAVFPDARVIIVLRRQDTFVRSLYRQYVKSGGTDTIRRYLGLDGRHLPAMTLDRFEFSTYLRYLFECFPAGVLVLTFEEFVSDQPRFLSRFCEFVGTDIPDVTLKRENATRLGYFGMNVTRVLNFLLHSVVNDGPIPGIPYRKDGRWHQRSVVEYLHDHWPGRPSSNKGSPLVEVGNEVWERFRENNRQIDRELGLGLDKFGYY